MNVKSCFSLIEYISDDSFKFLTLVNIIKFNGLRTHKSFSLTKKKKRTQIKSEMKGDITTVTTEIERIKRLL